ncbi:hypothetical protein EROM_031150 [Encephalitozoon romaleae SJ-2008]|uniref:WD40 domain-containing protein n=1 Tax=Encephalitozoon romaleae (strain SJ-2008) TaxID=1178016 RepID=I7AQY5_ENCRO|nr:hypothetical protein EROM_031150 [Encephalitozoon romaleae SJ-2008]AFN82737.1 hypothetical protein EROM_031150 [Encephalitozoon romaleae SJ-2008]
MRGESQDDYKPEQSKTLSSRAKGYKKKSLDIVRLERGRVTSQEILEKYRKPGIIEAMERPIESVVFRNKLSRVRGRIGFDDLALYNIGKCITAMSLPAKHSKYIFVGIKEGFQGESTFRFSSEASEVYLFDQSLNLRHVLSFKFGYCRKMETIQEKNVIRCVALFSDGFIRRFDFEEEIKNMTLIETEEMVNFEICWDYNLIFATDGKVLVWIQQNSVVSVFSGVKGMITSITIKRGALQEGRDEGCSLNCTPLDKSSLEFYALCISGKIFRFDYRFQEKKRISFPSGYTFIKYLSQVATLIIVDTLNNITKVLYDEGDSQRTSTMFNYSLSCCRSSDKRILIGGFDGTIRNAKVNKRKARVKTLFQVVRKGDEVILGHSEEEFKRLDSKGRPFNDNSERVVDLCMGGSDLFAAYECGIVVALGLA